MTDLRQRQPRIAEPQYLAWLRKQPCACGCGSPSPSDAAHLRAGSLLYDKPITGMGTKPDDRWALPLRHDHHMAQHRYGSEIEWWNLHGIDPFARAIWYHTMYLVEADTKGQKWTIERPTTPPSWKSKPRAKTRQQASWPKKSRKIASRGFAKRRNGA